MYRLGVYLLSIVAGATVSVAAPNNHAALQIYARLSTQPGNLVISPVSVSDGLAMSYAGARGETAGQIASVFKGNRRSGRMGSALGDVREKSVLGFEVSSVSALIVQAGYPIRADFERLLLEDHGAALKRMNLTGWPGKFDEAVAADARREINRWIAKETRARISAVIPESIPTPLTRLLLVNAIWSKGEWALPFDKRKTRARPFRMESGEVVFTPTMHIQAAFNYLEQDALHMLELPYRNDRFSMVILVPMEGGTLGDVETALTADASLSFLGKLREADPVELELALPRFKVQSALSLRETLGQLGITRAFSEREADFSGISSRQGLFIEDVIHQASIEIDEAGSVAAGATVVVAGEADPLEVRVDRPFVFMIVDRAREQLVFLGRVVDPFRP